MLLLIPQTQVSWFYLALVLGDRHGVLHVRQSLHVGVVGFAFLSVILLLIELLHRGADVCVRALQASKRAFRLQLPLTENIW